MVPPGPHSAVRPHMRAIPRSTGLICYDTKVGDPYRGGLPLLCVGVNPSWQSPIDMRRRLVVGLAIVIVVMVAVGSYIVVFNPFAKQQFKASLTQSGSGDSLTWWDSGNLTKILYTNITLTFTSPSNLDPTRLNFTISKPGEKILFDSAVLLSSIHLVYSSGQFPHWLAELGSSTSSVFTGTILNPGGSIVGGTWNHVVEDDRIESGAIMTLTFPSYANSTQGYVVVATYQGASGNATLTLGT